MQVTVPSSGTRYINSSVRNAGYNILSLHFRNYEVECDRGKPDLVYGHPSHTPLERLEKYANLVENRYIVIRDPIKTWATNYVDWREERRTNVSRNKMALSHQQQIGPSWEYQNTFVDRYDPYIHRVDKDGIEKFAEWAGIEAVPGKRYSTPSRMKDAVEQRDMDMILYLCEGTDYWKWFVEEATPIFADFYEQQGYDLWWT
jgi:hypothetical protein